jgi:hypothetical protein
LRRALRAKEQKLAPALNVVVEGQVFVGKGLKREKRYAALDLESQRVLFFNDKAALNSGAEPVDAVRLDEIGQVEVKDKEVTVNLKSGPARVFEAKTAGEAEDWGSGIPNAQRDAAAIRAGAEIQAKQVEESAIRAQLAAAKAPEPEPVEEEPEPVKKEPVYVAPPEPVKTAEPVKVAAAAPVAALPAPVAPQPEPGCCCVVS